MLFSLAAWVIGSVLTILWGTVSLAASLLDSSGRWAHKCMVAWSRMNLRLLGTRLEVAGLEHVRQDGPQIFAANHQSIVDILVLAAILPVPFRFLAKQELFRIPFIGWHMRRAGFIPIDRRRPRLAARTLLESAERIRRGVNTVVFPEGTRSEDGVLLPFRGGAFLLAHRAQVPVVPIVIRGTRAILRKNDWRVHGATARVQVLPPVDTTLCGEDRDQLAAEVRRAIESAQAPASPSHDLS